MSAPARYLVRWITKSQLAHLTQLGSSIALKQPESEAEIAVLVKLFF
ncbi:MAG: hypothetical protein AAFY57_06000 [Cyanobacteria bacterium J06642_2]